MNRRSKANAKAQRANVQATGHITAAQPARRRATP